MAQTADSLVLSAQHFQQMLEHLLACLPAEGCGMLGGQPGELRSRLVLPVPNHLRSPVRFRMDPEAQLKAFYALEAQGLDLLAVFHSHPAGPDHPSATDLAEFAYPGVLYLIWAPAVSRAPADLNTAPLHAQDWQCRAFRIEHGSYAALPIEIRPENSNPDAVEGL